MRSWRRGSTLRTPTSSTAAARPERPSSPGARGAEPLTQGSRPLQLAPAYQRNLNCRSLFGSTPQYICVLRVSAEGGVLSLRRVPACPQVWAQPYPRECIERRPCHLQCLRSSVRGRRCTSELHRHRHQDGRGGVPDALRGQVGRWHGHALDSVNAGARENVYCRRPCVCTRARVRAFACVCVRLRASRIPSLLVKYDDTSCLRVSCLPHPTTIH